MSVSIRQPAKYQGIQELFPPEMASGMEELIRRLSVNHNAIQTDVADQTLPSTGTTDATTYDTTAEADARLALQLVTE